MHGLMNNTKWRELLSLLSQNQVYIQLKLVGDDDFPIDTEQSNLVIRAIGPSSFIFVRKEFEYKQISQLKIITNQLPKSHSQVEQGSFASLISQIKRITINELLMVEDGIILNGYD
ncbi:hypothetical protein [Vibrio campbellii]|uniref:Uncharacterized protein n=1 Tax=Vibrio campbellii TaxID=680 RepID=A0ABY5IH09_9VIBR|nr:hypothetical protein [Vibrio campbellii]UTZ24297.1 hypothetical protein HB760_21435 [Vibrio campbellii]UTZ33566.1 hypothetical protein HB762_20025 [Vibrio campbellii]